MNTNNEKDSVLPASMRTRPKPMSDEEWAKEQKSITDITDMLPDIPDVNFQPFYDALDKRAHKIANGIVPLVDGIDNAVKHVITPIVSAAIKADIAYTKFITKVKS